MAELDLSGPLAPVLGAKTAKALETGLGLRTVEDLLRHYPRRYAVRGELTDLSTVKEGEQVTVMAEIVAVCDIIKERADKAAERWCAPAFYSVKELLAIGAQPDNTVPLQRPIHP